MCPPFPKSALKVWHFWQALSRSLKQSPPFPCRAQSLMQLFRHEKKLCKSLCASLSLFLANKLELGKVPLRGKDGDIVLINSAA